MGPNKRVGWGEKSKNDNRVDSFIWHLGVNNLFKFSAQESVLAPFIENGTKFKMPSEIKPPLIFPT